MSLRSARDGSQQPGSIESLQDLGTLDGHCSHAKRGYRIVSWCWISASCSSAVGPCMLVYSLALELERLTRDRSHVCPVLRSLTQNYQAPDNRRHCAKKSPPPPTMTRPDTAVVDAVLCRSPGRTEAVLIIVPQIHKVHSSIERKLESSEPYARLRSKSM